MKKRKHIIQTLMLLAFSTWTTFVQAQLEHPMAMLKKIKKANTGKVITYDYTVKLIKGNSAIDSSKGKLFKNGLDYLDSNNVAITANGSGYYFSLNNHQKTITVISIDKVKEQLGFSLDESATDIIAIPDSFIQRFGKINMDILGNGNYHIRITFEELQYAEIELEIDDKTLLVKKMRLIGQIREDGYRQDYYIYNIRRQFEQKILDLKRFFTVDKNEVVLNKKYSGYQINTITN